MNKFLKVMIVLLAIAAVATPAMAELKLNGYFRTQMITQQLSSSAADDVTMVDQRLRFKLTYGVNDNISIVHYTEVDTPWGSQSKGSIGGGGKAGADGVNIETKNAYVDLKINDYKAKVGIQGFTLGFDYAIIGNDLAGLTVSKKLSDTADLTVGYFKAAENTNTATDDDDIYAAKLNLKVAEGTKLGAGLLVVDANSADVTDDAMTYIIAAQGNFDLGAIALNAAAAYSAGDDGSGNSLGGYFATVKASGKAGNISYGGRVLYYSGDDDVTDGATNDAFKGDITGGAYEYYNEGSEIFLTSASYNNSGSPRLAMVNAYDGHGLVGLVGNVKMKYDSGVYSMLSAGYYSVVEENGAADSDLGYEVVAQVGTKLAEKADLSLTGAYAGLGDFYTNPVNDSLYKINLMLNVSF